VFRVSVADCDSDLSAAVVHAHLGTMAVRTVDKRDCPSTLLQPINWRTCVCGMWRRATHAPGELRIACIELGLGSSREGASRVHPKVESHVMVVKPRFLLDTNSTVALKHNNGETLP